MNDLLTSCKYKLLAVFSMVGILGLAANYFFPHLETDFFVLLLWFGASALFLSVVLSLGQSQRQQKSPGSKVASN